MMDDCTLYTGGKEYRFLECPVCGNKIPIIRRKYVEMDKTDNTGDSSCSDYKLICNP
jgi:hypothetical protein